MAIWTYEDLKFYEWMLEEVKKNHGIEYPEVIEERIVEIKRMIRKQNKRIRTEVIVKDYGIDGYIVKFPLPEYLKTEEDAIEYFREEEYIRYRPTYYDCTGQAFTSWFKIFQKPDGRFWAYHSVGYDV